MEEVAEEAAAAKRAVLLDASLVLLESGASQLGRTLSRLATPEEAREWELLGAFGDEAREGAAARRARRPRG